MVVTLAKAALVLVAAVAVAIVIARIAFALSAVEDRWDSVALPPSEGGPLAEALADREGHTSEGLTGIAALRSGADAFAARMILADRAVSSIDAQYYIWHADLTGYLLLDALKRAADRGVRVRLLLDDNGTAGLDAEIAALVAHPNVEVRLWNPFNLRGRLKTLSYGFDFFRLNRRMHNKSFTVDGRATILGGRNVGDEYFGTGPMPLYVDLDVLAVGAIVPEVSADFDRYWASPAVHPAGPIVGAADGADPIGAGLARLRGDPQMDEYRAVLAASDVVAALERGTLDLEWTTAVLVSDDPVKGQGAVPREDLLASRLREAVGEIEARFDGISPYFVPGAAGVEAFATLEARGVAVRMLTNALEATDVLPVHAGYAKRRGAMLRSGVELFELRRQAAPDAPADRFGPFGILGVEPSRQDLRRGRGAHLRRLVQLRPALDHAEHRDGPADRQRGHGAGHARCLRPRPRRTGMARGAAGRRGSLDRPRQQDHDPGRARLDGAQAGGVDRDRLAADRMAAVRLPHGAGWTSAVLRRPSPSSLPSWKGSSRPPRMAVAVDQEGHNA